MACSETPLIPDDSHWEASPCESTSTVPGGGGSGGDPGGGGSGGTGGTYTGITITGSTFSSGTISNSTITSSTFSLGSITGSSFSGGSISGTTIGTSSILSPTISTPTVTGGSLSSPTISSPTITGGTITGAALRSVPTPTLSGDAVNKAYVDAISSSGLQIKTPVDVLTSTNVTLSGGAPLVVDDITLVNGSRVLVKGQTDPKENGIYSVTTVGTGSNGTWARSTDADLGSELELAYALVLSGTVYSGSSYVQTTPSVTLGSSDVVWTLYFASGDVPATRIVGTIVEGQIADLAINLAKFAASIRPVELVATLPTTGLTAGRVVFLTSNSKLYRYTGSAWTTVVESVDVTGQFGPTSIENAAITEAKLANNSVSAAKITAGAVVAGKIAANAVTATEIAAGSITAIKIAANTITANELAANSIVAGKIAAGAISTTELAVGSVSQTRIADGAIVSAKIAASQILGSHILAGTITADKITVIGGLSALSADLGTMTAGTITASAQIDVGVSENRVRITTSGLSVGGVTVNGASSQNTIGISGLYPASITGGVAGASVRVGQIGNGGTVSIAQGLTEQITVTGYGTVGRNLSGRFELQALSGNSLAFTTNGAERFFIGGTDGHFKSNGGYLMKSSSDGWSPKLYDGGHTLEFKWDGGLHVRIDGSTELDIATT